MLRGHREVHSLCSSLVQRTSSILSSFTPILDESMRYWLLLKIPYYENKKEEVVECQLVTTS